MIFRDWNLQRVFLVPFVSMFAVDQVPKMTVQRH